MTSRRRARRLRSQARFRWFLHRTGIRRLGLAQLQGLLRRLSAHHSKDPQLLRVIGKAIQVAMATQNTTYPWHCTCGSLNGKRAIHCPLCGQHWTVGTPHSNQPKQVSSHSTPSHQWGRRSTTPHRGKGWYQNAQAAEEEQWVKSPRNHAARQR